MPVNCACLTRELAESELFGHENGAFTGAMREKSGLFETARNGTLFLDEIAELNLELQARLLRVLQEGTIRRVGATKEIPVTPYIVSATHRDLEEMMDEGRFRDDLFYRISQVVLEVPPLDARGLDIAAISRAFLKNDAVLKGRNHSLAHEAVDVLMQHDWPGNIRELQAVLRHASLLARGRSIRAFHIKRALGSKLPQPRVPTPHLNVRLRGLLEAGTEMSAQELCDALRISRTTLMRKLEPWIERGTITRTGKGAGTRYRPGLEADRGLSRHQGSPTAVEGSHDDVGPGSSGSGHSGGTGQIIPLDPYLST